VRELVQEHRARQFKDPVRQILFLLHVLSPTPQAATRLVAARDSDIASPNSELFADFPLDSAIEPHPNDCP
jgi:hypothetical protein